MKYYFIFLLSFPVYGALSPSLVKESALRFHPSVLAAIEAMKAGEEQITGAKGAFDTKVVSDYKRQVLNEYSTTLHRTFLVKPLRAANSRIYAGAEQISNPNGRLSPVYNTGNPATTGQPGMYSVLGLQLSLWKNFTIDPSRADLKTAQLNSKIVKAKKHLTDLDIARFSQLAYWEWVTARKVKTAYEELLKNGELRNEYLVARNKKGDIAKILVTENEQYIASRKGALQASTERFIRAEYALSLFFRDDNGLPITPSSEDAYEDYPEQLAALLENLDVTSNIDELIKKRPDMKTLSLTADKTDVDLELAKQDLRPQIDITTEYFKRAREDVSMPKDYLMVMAQVSIPIERNLGNGNIAAARARKLVAEKEMGLGQQTYKFEVLALRKALHLQLEQVVQSEIEFTKAKELVVSETYRFKTGGGNLFLVNIREEAQARAEASFHEARLSFMNTLLTYQALVTTI